MKYVVDVDGVEVVVELDQDRARLDGEEIDARLDPVPGTPLYTATVGGVVYRVAAERGIARGEYTLWTDTHRFEVEALDERAKAIEELSLQRAIPAGPESLLAPMPGLILRVNVRVGDAVEVGQGLVVMEAMKMENELRAPSDGVVKRVLVDVGTAVEKGAVLVEMD